MRKMIRWTESDVQFAIWECNLSIILSVPIKYRHDYETQRSYWLSSAEMSLEFDSFNRRCFIRFEWLQHRTEAATLSFHVRETSDDEHKANITESDFDIVKN